MNNRYENESKKEKEREKKKSDSIKGEQMKKADRVREC